MRNTSYTGKSTLSHDIQWKSINWFHINRYVEEVQQRIYRAECLGNKRKVRDLQRMLVRSRAMLLLSIRKVTQINKGKKTAGIDGITALTSKERLELYQQMDKGSIELHKPKPSYRTYIKKKNGKLRPLSIPTIKDRIYQNIIKGALEPQWEARFESISYGFRPKRSCHDALKRIFLSACHGNKKWAFEGDFKGCFDNLSHDYIMEQIKEFPYIDIIKKWLKAGYMDNNVYNETEFGSGQGNIVSPLIANIALKGMEDALGIQYKTIKKNGETYYTNISPYTLVFYADDFIVLCNSKDDANRVYELLTPYLEKRGLTLSEEKTKVVPLNEGFDFLGFNVRIYDTCQGEKLLIKPSKETLVKAKTTIRETIKTMNGSNVTALIGKLNPIIIGLANYWSPWVSKHAYATLDHYIWSCTTRFLKRLHNKKAWKWIYAKYYKPDKTGQSKDRWILTEPNDNNQLKKMSWTPIIRHPLIRFKASPYNTELKEYFIDRDTKEYSRYAVGSRQKLAKKQSYKCPICSQAITDFSEKLKVKLKIPEIHDGKREYKNMELVHARCSSLYYKFYPEKGKLPTTDEIKTCYKEIKKQKLAMMI